MVVFTVGFTRKPAKRFFELVRDSGAKRIVDVRLNNSSQLSGFAKKDDLAFFLAEICGVAYVHAPDLAPTADMLKAYRAGQMDWATYERRFLDLTRTPHRRDNVEAPSRRWLPALQRGSAATLPSALGCRVSP